MGFKPPFAIGDTVSNAVMTEAFKIGNMGGMRRSKTTGTLVLISDRTKGLYSDKWQDGVLHYTGMGKVGDQTLSGNQNKTLAESGSNGIEVHLFEVDEPGRYTYSGVVELAGEPYQETQQDDNGSPRNVWMFPLRKVKGKGTTQGESSGNEYANDESSDATALENTIVYHKQYGKGVVNTIKGDKIYIDFSCGQRIFQYPEAFDKGYIYQ